MSGRSSFVAVLLALGVVLGQPAPAAAQSSQPLTLRGHQQWLRVYGTRGRPPLVVASGDGGWMHLAPQVAEFLAAQGFLVIGFDARAYLASFTSGTRTLDAGDEPADFAALAAVAAAMGDGHRPLLIGISEGAGLSLLAATSPVTRQAIAGVVALGLPRFSELGWRWRDSLIYVTHGVPNEPTFDALEIIGKAAPSPVAAIHSTHDEFVALAEVRRVMAAAGEPHRLWVVESGDHRFSDSQPEFHRRLLEAIAWVQANGVR